MRIVITSGEPAGVGPELCYYLATQAWDHQLVVIADKKMLATRIEACAHSASRRSDYGLKAITLRDYDPTHLSPSVSGELTVLDLKLNAPTVVGKLERANAPYVLGMLDRAHQGLITGEFDALVTAPISKEVLDSKEHPFTGHTEYLQQKCGVKRVVMLLGCPQMRVALATTHLPLKDVSAAITPQVLTEVIEILDHDLREKFGCPNPHIYVAGLNPHAGENGHLGREELDVIIPTLEKLRQQGIDLKGPLPADSMFNAHNLKDASAFLCMYHDQGLPVLKYAGFEQGYNTTLGLPYIRTSVDHGTALDIAGQGLADPNSLKCAVALATEMVHSRKRFAAAHANPKA